MSKWERINKQHGNRKSNYPSFDKALDLYFGDNPPTSKEKLRDGLRNHAFHVIDNERQDPTDKQLNHSWEYIKKNYFPEQKHVEDYYSTETYRKRYVYRANKNIIIKGKKYRKGQFTPKQEMLDIE